jgi:hypothetical protein
MPKREIVFNAQSPSYYFYASRYALKTHKIRWSEATHSNLLEINDTSSI